MPAIAGALLTPAPAAVAATGDVGFVGVSFDGVSAPTAEKPQSKLWHHLGRWWGVLFDTASDDYTIHRFDWNTNTWTNTGVFVENRNRTHSDALSDGNVLYVATGLIPGASSSDSSAYLRRYTYDPSSQRYNLDAGYPVALHGGALEAIVIDKDTHGILWSTFTVANASGGRNVMVTHSTTDDRTWVAPYVVPTAGATTLTSDDISAVVAFRSQIGIMWSNQNENAMYFATHADGAPDNAWQLTPALQGPRYADDHINLKSLQAGPEGEVLAAVKTELQHQDAPLILLLVLNKGSWSRHTFGTVNDNHTRPLVIVDDENREAYMFAASPCCSGGSIYMKQTPLANISFPAGLGTPFIRSSANTTINNPSSTKQAVNGTTGLVVIAGDDRTDRYLFNKIALASSLETTIDGGPSGVVPADTASFSFSASVPAATFECRLDGGSYAVCTSPKSYAGLLEGPHTFTVRAVDGTHVDLTPASRSWTVNAAAPTVVAVSPADGAGEVGTATVVTASFSEPIDPTSVSTSTIQVAATAGGDPVPASVQYDATSRMATLRPSTTLAVGTEYGVTVRGGTNGVRDTAGSALAGDTTWAFTTEAADVSPPDTRIGDSSPTGTLFTSRAVFEFSSSEAGSRFECRLDGGVYLGCASPYELLDMEDGQHTFEVRAVDAASNVDPTPAARTWTINALILSDGFESGNLAAWAVRTNGDGTAVVQSAIVRSGAHAARLGASTAPNSYSYAFADLPAARTDATVAVDVRIPSEGASGKSVGLLALKSSSGSLVEVWRVNGSGALVVQHGSTSTVMTGSLPLDTWGRLVVRVVTAGSGVSTVEVTLNGTSIHRTTVASLGTEGVRRIQIGSTHKRQRFDAVFDGLTVRR